MRLILLGGFLGAGKTTTMIAAGRMWEARGERVAVIVNDQGADLVDGRIARNAALSGVGEVAGGCFCCRFEDLTTVLTGLMETAAPTVVLAEAVGSCSDLQATVIAPFRVHHPELHTAPLAVLVDPFRYAALSSMWRPDVREPDLSYLYRHQIDEAELIALNKADLLTPEEQAELDADLARRFPRARRLVMSARTGAGLDDLLAFWTGEDDGVAAQDRADSRAAGPAAGRHRGFDLDYDRYGAAEAELAWTNQAFVLNAVGAAGFDTAGFDAAAWAQLVLREVAHRALPSAADAGGQVIGHVKLAMTTPAGSLTASLTADGGTPSVTGEVRSPVRRAEVILNARVRTDPERLRLLLTESLAAAKTLGVGDVGELTGEFFRPGYPVPVHRM